MKTTVSKTNTPFSDTINIPGPATARTSRIRSFVLHAGFIFLFLVASAQAQSQKNIPMKENIAWLEEQLNSLNHGKNYKPDAKKKFTIRDCEFNFSHRVGNERNGLSISNSFPLKDIAKVQYTDAGNNSNHSFDLQITLDKSASGNASAFSPYVISLYTSDEALVRKIAERLELAKRECKSAK